MEVPHGIVRILEVPYEILCIIGSSTWNFLHLWKFLVGFCALSGLDINVCPVPVKTNVGQVDPVLRLSDGASEKIRDSQTFRYD